MFDPKKSSTYKNFSCSARECRLVDEMSPQAGCRVSPEVCLYNIKYEDGSNTIGQMAKETMTLATTSGSVVTLKDIVFGCSHMSNAGTFTENIMGIIGVGRGPLSFVSQIAPYVGGNKFSHCLLPPQTDPKIESKIYFGNHSEVSGENVVSVPLVETENLDRAYGVIVKGITIGDKFIQFAPIGSSLQNSTMIIDSGTTITTIPQDFFDRIITHLKELLDPKSETSIVTIPGGHPCSFFCIKGTIPELNMSVHFEGDRKLQYTVQQMFMRDVVNDDRVCLKMLNTSDPMINQDVFGIYGSTLMENLLVGYDLDKNVVSFKPSNCIN